MNIDVTLNSAICPLLAVVALMRTVDLSLLSILLLLFPLTEGGKIPNAGSTKDSSITKLSENHISEWCTTKTKQLLAPIDAKTIEESCRNRSPRDTCFGEGAFLRCRERISDKETDRNLGECAVNTIFSKFWKEDNVKRAVHGACEKYRDFRNLKGQLNCDKAVPACLKNYKKTNKQAKTNLGTPEQANKWCSSSYKGKIVALKAEPNGKHIAYGCYKLFGESAETNTDWLTNDVANCAFHSIAQKANGDYQKLMGEACAFFKFYGYKGKCEDFTSHCRISLRTTIGARACTVKTNKHLIPDDIEKIRKKCSNSGEEQGSCFGKEVTQLCRSYEEEPGNVLKCSFHTSYFSKYSGNATEAENTAIKIGCEHNLNTTAFNCDEFVGKCRSRFKAEEKNRTKVTDKVNSWCGKKNKGGLVPIEKDGKRVVLKCYKKWNTDTNKVATTDWITENVLQCTFHSIFINRTIDERNRNKLATQACEYFKSFGFAGRCGDFSTECAKNLDPLYKAVPTEAPTTNRPKPVPTHMTEAALCGVKNTETVDRDPEILKKCSKDHTPKSLVLLILGKCRPKCKGEAKDLKMQASCVGKCAFASIYRATCSDNDEKTVKSNIITMMQEGCESFKKKLTANWDTESLKCSEYAEQCYKKMIKMEPRTTTQKSTTTSTTRTTLLTTQSSTETTASTSISTSTVVTVPVTRVDRYTKEWEKNTAHPGVQVKKEDEDDGGRALRLERERREKEEEMKESERRDTWTYVGAGIGGAVVILILIIVVAVVVVRMRKKRKAKADAEKLPTLTSRKSASSKKESKKQPPSLKEDQEQMKGDVVNPAEFKHEGPLRVDVGLHGKPVEHATGEVEGHSIQEVIFDETLNRIARIGSQIEQVNTSEMETAEGQEEPKKEVVKAEKSKDKSVDAGSDDKSKKTKQPKMKARKKPSRKQNK